jgi:aminomethyltransferase
VKGPNALDFLQYICSNDVAALLPGKVQYSCFPNHQGGIVDDLLVYRLGDQEYLLVINAANIDKDWNWIQQENKRFDAQISNISDDVAQIAVQGPDATALLQEISDARLSDVPYYTFVKTRIAGIDNVLISATGYTGSGGFEIYSDNASMPLIWDAVMEVGNKYDLMPAGLGCRDTLRLEMGYCLYGNDINEDTSPLEAGLAWITKFNKDFIAKDLLLHQKEEGLSRRLKGFLLLEKGIPRPHYEILNLNEEPIGEVTSGTQAPSLDKAIAMGFVKAAEAKKDAEVFIKIRNKLVRAKIVSFPFYKA